MRETGDGTETIPVDDITFEFEKYVGGTYESTTEAVNATYYKLIVKTADTDEWKEGSAEFEFEIKKIDLGTISLSKVYDGKNTLEKTDWEETAVLDSESSLTLIVTMKSADVGSEVESSKFMLDGKETVNYAVSDINAEITKKKIEVAAFILEMDYEAIAKDSDGYVKKVFSDIEGYPGLKLTVYPYNSKVQGEFIPSSAYAINASGDLDYVKDAVKNTALANGKFPAYVDLGSNYELPAGGYIGKLNISKKTLTGTVTVSKQYDKDKTIRVTDLSGLEGICDEDKKKLELVITMDSEKPGASVSSYELHYHPNGNTTCTSETGDECPTVRYELSSDVQVNATIEKKTLELSSTIYSVVPLYRTTATGGTTIPVRIRKFYVESNGDSFAVTYSNSEELSDWMTPSVKTVNAEDITIPEEYIPYYEMSGSSSLNLLSKKTTTELTLGNADTEKESSSSYKIYSIELVKDKRYKITLGSDASKKEKIGVVSQSGIHPYISTVRQYGARDCYTFTASAGGTYYVIVAYPDITTPTYSVTVSVI